AGLSGYEHSGISWSDSCGVCQDGSQRRGDAYDFFEHRSSIDLAAKAHVELVVWIYGGACRGSSELRQLASVRARIQTMELHLKPGSFRHCAASVRQMAFASKPLFGGRRSYSIVLGQLNSYDGSIFRLDGLDDATSDESLIRVRAAIGSDDAGMT